MPKRKKEIEIAEVNEEPIIEVDPDDQEIDMAFADLPQNEPCIELFRTSKVGGRPVFLEQMSPSMFSLAYVAEKFGGGNYVARSRYKDGRKIRASFEIEGDPFPVKRVIPNPAIAPMHAQPAMGQSVNSQTSDGPIILEGNDPNQAMVQLVNVMLKRMENSETVLLEKMRLYKELFGGPKETPLDTALNMFQKGLEMAALTGAENSSPWLMLVRELKEPLSKIVDTVQIALQKSASVPASAPATGAKPSAPLPSNGPVVASTGQPERPSEDVAMVQSWLKAMLPPLVTAAAKNADPATYADFILDQVPNSAYPQLLEWLRQPGCLESLCAIEPGIRYQQDWWLTLRQSLIEALTDELSDADRSVQSSAPPNAPTSDPTASSAAH
jgi:hypothetical protein